MPPILSHIRIMDFSKLLLLLSTILVPVLIGTMVFKRLPIYARYIVLFFYANLFSDATSLILSKVYGNNMIVYYFFVSIAAVFLGVSYSKFLSRSFTGLFLIVPASAILEGVLTGTDHFNSYSFTIFNALLIFICLLTFYKMTLLEAGTEIFYFNGILFFYALSSTLFFFSARYLQQNDVTLMTNLFNIHSYINSITNLLFGYSIWTLFKSYSSAQ